METWSPLWFVVPRPSIPAGPQASCSSAKPHSSRSGSLLQDLTPTRLLNWTPELFSSHIWPVWKRAHLCAQRRCRFLAVALVSMMVTALRDQGEPAGRQLGLVLLPNPGWAPEGPEALCIGESLLFLFKYTNSIPLGKIRTLHIN